MGSPAAPDGGSLGPGRARAPRSLSGAPRTRAPLRLLGAVLACAVAAGGADSAADARPGTRRARACEGRREPLPATLTYRLRWAAFAEDAGASVAVHVPPGFDATRRPGLVVYFHGWQGCVGASLADEEAPCTEGGDPRPGAALARQLDESGANALLVAVELRVDLPTGEPGRLAMPGTLRLLLHELFAEHLSGALGCELQVDGLERVVVMAHSGGYQAAASALQFGDLPQVSEVDLLDALYGADDVFARWLRQGVARFDPRAAGARRFVNLYTCCGGTVERSRAMAAAARAAAAAAGWGDAAVYDDDGDGELAGGTLRRSFVSKRVPRAHGELPRQYARELFEAAGFERIAR
ncbi:MAG TPA: hypothetical protein VE987_09935 [Polyangiaceae bacterium]|nr:hypothetical protein [Polyangiaceae bacterium]